MSRRDRLPEQEPPVASVWSWDDVWDGTEKSGLAIAENTVEMALDGVQIKVTVPKGRFSVHPDRTPFPVDQGIPIPPAPRVGRKKGRKPEGTKYPFDRMEIGDSFFIPCPPHRTARSIQGSLHDRLRLEELRHHRRYCTRTFPNGVRCWRTE